MLKGLTYVTRDLIKKENIGTEKFMASSFSKLMENIDLQIQ